MELIINNATYILKPVNFERRDLFVNLVLKNYNLECEDFDVFIEQVQKTLIKYHGIKLTKERVKINFFKEHEKSVLKCLWSFIQDHDKKDLRTLDNISVSSDQLVKFIEYVSSKIKEYCEYVTSINNDSVKQDIYSIISFVAKNYGWSFPEILEMDNLELYKAIENAISINKDEQLTEINTYALGSALAQGSKEARSQVQKMHNRKKVADYEKTNPKLEVKNELSREELKKILDADG